MSHASKIPSTEAAARALVEAGALSTDLSKRVTHITDGHEEVVLATGADGEVKVLAPATSAVRRSLSAPRAARGHLLFTRVADLAEFVRTFKQPGTVIFAAPPTSSTLIRDRYPDSIAPGFTAVIDHSAGMESLAWNRFRGEVRCITSKEVAAWSKSYSQTDFADLIDDWADRVVPDGDATAENLLHMASDLEIDEHRVLKVTRDPKTRLFSAQLKEGATAKTTIYPRFKIQLPIIEGRDPVEVDIRLKLAKKGNDFVFEVGIHQLEDHINREFKTMGDELAKATEVPVWQGVAPAEMAVGI